MSNIKEAEIVSEAKESGSKGKETKEEVVPKASMFVDILNEL
jgi:hypothetical protein